MRLLLLSAASLLALGVSFSDTRAEDNRQQMVCHFKSKGGFDDAGFESDKGRGKNKCVAVYRHCSAPPPLSASSESLECKETLKIECSGLQVYFEDFPPRQVINQYGIGITLFGDENSDFPHIAIDQAIFFPFERVFASLYLTPWERLDGRCTSNIEVEVAK